MHAAINQSIARGGHLEDLEAGERAGEAGAPRHLHAAPVEDADAPGLAVDVDGEVSAEAVGKAAAAAQPSVAGGGGVRRGGRGGEPAPCGIAGRACFM